MLQSMVTWNSCLGLWWHNASLQQDKAQEGCLPHSIWEAKIDRRKGKGTKCPLRVFPQ